MYAIHNSLQVLPTWLRSINFVKTVQQQSSNARIILKSKHRQNLYVPAFQPCWLACLSSRLLRRERIVKLCIYDTML